MVRHSTLGACVLSLALVSAASAQTSSTEATSVMRTVKAGEVVSVAGNKVVLREADGNHEYTLPEGFKFQIDGRDVGVDQLQPGMKVGAMITDKVTTRDVTETRIASGTVVQIAPGGIVVQDAQKAFKSYNFKDADGNDIYYVKDGKEVSLRDVKKGERLSGTFITKYPAQTTSQRSVSATAVAPPPPAPSPGPAVAAVTPARLPKTASPVPLIGLLAALSAGLALALRAARAGRR